MHHRMGQSALLCSNIHRCATQHIILEDMLAIHLRRYLSQAVKSDMPASITSENEKAATLASLLTRCNQSWMLFFGQSSFRCPLSNCNVYRNRSSTPAFIWRSCGISSRCFAICYAADIERRGSLRPGTVKCRYYANSEYTCIDIF